MHYNYRCPSCGRSQYLYKKVDERDNANCEGCNTQLKRVFNSTVTIAIPTSFQTNWSDIGPQDDYDEETWKREVVKA